MIARLLELCGTHAPQALTNTALAQLERDFQRATAKVQHNPILPAHSKKNLQARLRTEYENRKQHI